MEFTDSDLVFHMEVYKGYFDITRWCLGRIRSCYPTARIVLVSDGDPDPRYKEFLSFGIELEYGEHLYSGELSGPLWIRRFENYLRKPAKYLIRTDSDVGFYRRFHQLPQSKCIFGTPCGEFIQGGILGITHDAILGIMSSGLLKESRMRGFSHEANGVWMASDDAALGWVARVLGIPMVSHPEFHSTWQLPVPNYALRYAVMHPCKNGSL